jgi:UDP-glucose 4-epimerase
VLEVIRTVESVTGLKVPWKMGPRRPGDPARLVGSSEKAIRELGWKPQLNTLETIVETAWRWHRDHPRGYNG